MISRPSGRYSTRSRNMRSRPERSVRSMRGGLVPSRRASSMAERNVARRSTERGFDPAKRPGRLRHLSKGDFPQEEVRRHDDIGDDDVGLKPDFNSATEKV